MNGFLSSPDVDVQQSEYQRLLGLPHQMPLDGRMEELSAWARDWYAEHGTPWVYTRPIEAFMVENDSLQADSVTLTGSSLVERLVRSEAHGLVLTAVSAGPELEAEAQRLWELDQPDEYFFLTVFGSAVVERLTTTTGGRLCAWADERNMAVLPHYSPGYPGWPVTDQQALWNGLNVPDAPLEVLDSGMLRPKKSQLALFGLTRRTDLTRRLTDLIPCENCSLSNCQYRRKPYRISAQMAEEADAVEEAMKIVGGLQQPSALTHDAAYALKPRVLQRWADQRMDLEHLSGGGIVATFHSEGSTCSDQGIPLAFDHTITLSAREDGYVIQALSCRPTSKSEGHTRMCSYLQKGQEQLDIIDGEHHFMGQPLNKIITWQPAVLPAGCYCRQDSRNHKWRNAFQTLHYALVQYEKDTSRNTDG
ncbi:MAG: hypothetical protein AAF492_16715 [Verrucomicrobiota bacterium]